MEDIMKSQVEHYLPFDEILLREPYRAIEIPSWEAIINPVVQGVITFYNHQHQTKETELTDEMVKALDNPELKTVHQVKQYAMTAFQEREKERKFQFDIFPYLLVFFANTTQTVINSDEEEAYFIAMTDNYKEDAEKAGISYDEFLQNSFGLTSKQEEELRERIHEYFVYKLIAIDRFGEEHGELDIDSYDAYIQEQVLLQGVDEIDLRERLPFNVFQDIYPEIVLTEELKNYFKDQIIFKIASEA